MSDNGVVVHRLRNQLSVVLGFCDILIDQCPEADTRTRADLWEIKTAAESSLELLLQIDQPAGKTS